MNLSLSLKICVASTHGKPTHTKQQRLHTFPCSKILTYGNHTPKKYDFNKVNNYTLFIVRACRSNICFLPKKCNLVYGKHLKELIKRGVAMKKLFCKVPSYIHRVKYKKVVDIFYKTVISDDKFENQTVLKTIANVAFGLLEKSYKRKIGFLIILRRQYGTGKNMMGGFTQWTRKSMKNILNFKWRELEDDWTMEVDENNKPFC